jgi:hypothetical protein
VAWVSVVVVDIGAVRRSAESRLAEVRSGPRRSVRLNTVVENWAPRRLLPAQFLAGIVVLLKMALTGVEPVRSTLVRFTPWKLLPVRSRLLRLAVPRVALVNEVPAALAPVHTAPVSGQLERLVRARLALVKLTPVMVEACGSASRRSAPMSSARRGRGEGQGAA